jgi:uncharacterized protein YqeY
MLNARIQQDYTNAVKEQNAAKKLALSSLKAKILEGVKNNKNNELNDEQIVNIIISEIKKRNQSIESFAKANRVDLIEKEQYQIDLYQEYLPKQLTKEELEIILDKLLETTNDGKTNKPVVIGKTIGLFNKEYKGKAEIKLLTEILNEKLN